MHVKQDRPKLFLVPGKEKILERRHPWIFSGAIKRVEGNPKEGDVVDVLSSTGEWLAVGHFQQESIMVKVLSYDSTIVDEAFWTKRFVSAFSYRKRMGLFDGIGETSAFRLVNGEGDNMPGLIVDIYGGVVVLQAHSEGMHRMFPLFARIITNVLKDDFCIETSAIFDKSSATLKKGNALKQDGFILGTPVDECTYLEAGSRLFVNFYEGQKTGAFLDQSQNHNVVSAYSKGRRVLNAFGYTGGFSLAALRGGAEYVETVDISKRAIELCQRNVDANYPGAPHRGVVADVLCYLDEIPHDFDIIVLDPPAFAKTHRTLQQGLKGYRGINQKAMAAIKPGGLLFTFSCSQAVSFEDFKTMAFSAAALSHRQVRIVQALPHAVDHPVNIYHPEGEYLKGLLLEIE